MEYVEFAPRLSVIARPSGDGEKFVRVAQLRGSGSPKVAEPLQEPNQWLVLRGVRAAARLCTQFAEGQ